MTEEIIIDGVNVKDCKRRIGKNSYCRYFKRPCAENNFNCVWKQKVRIEQENKELKEWKAKVIILFESACMCKYLNEKSDICSYTNKKCININKCVYKYQELSDTYRSALEEIREMFLNQVAWVGQLTNFEEEIYNKINEVLK